VLLQIPALLDGSQAGRIRQRLDTAAWVDGRVTAGHQSARAKNNRQVAESDPLARELGDHILAVLKRNPLFISAALPNHVYPPLFNRYEADMAFGSHVDNAVRMIPGSGMKLRTDLSATLFLSEPDDYDGGELVVEDLFGVHTVKLAAGDLILYPASSLHRVTAVTRGCRLASFFWVQSLVRDDAQRTLLFDLDRAIQRLNLTQADEAARLQLTGSYHNLLRMWGDV
jgi:PKHD-type hydroxylase